MAVLRKTGLRGAAIACACAAALALAAAPAMGDGTSPNYQGSVLHVTASASSASSLQVTATGTNQAQPFSGVFDVITYLLEGSGKQCSEDEGDELGLVSYPTVDFASFTDGQGGRQEGSAGAFNVRFAATAPAGYSGPVTICAYSVWDFDTAAWASTTATVAAPATNTSGGGTKPPSGGGGKQPGAGKPKPQHPGMIARPRVTRQGNQLACSRGRWTGRPTTYRYRWVVTHRAGAQSLTNKLKVTRKLRGQQAECRVTASNSKGRATAISRVVNIT